MLYSKILSTVCFGEILDILAPKAPKLNDSYF